LFLLLLLLLLSPLRPLVQFKWWCDGFASATAKQLAPHWL
jgi:hypothetical protein